MIGYLNTGAKQECAGCGACANACPIGAIAMQQDQEGFYYPVINSDKCVHCNRCHAVCPIENMPARHIDNKLAYGGTHRSRQVLGQSTSGGAFTAIATSWWRPDSMVFGAATDGLRVYHDCIEDISQLNRFCKSKYLQSDMGNCYARAGEYLRQGRRVLFSGTPCQIAGLLAYLGGDQENLLCVEVVCEGVPTPTLWTATGNMYKKNTAVLWLKLTTVTSSCAPLAKAANGIFRACGLPCKTAKF